MPDEPKRQKRKKGKNSRKKDTKRAARIIFRKEKRRRNWEESKWIEVRTSEGLKKVLKPQWRTEHG